VSPGPEARRRSAAGLAVLAGVVSAAGLALAGDAAGPPLRSMRWAPRDADPVRAFATQPAECLKIPPDPTAARAVEVGRAAFRTPALLGGQAARAGLACEACHRGGRANPDFQFPGASGAPGTADVTLSLFSSHRGDGVFNPKPIPDLSGPRAALKIAPADRSAFIHGLITQEFDGPEPPPAVLSGLVAYVGALDPAACPVEPRTPVTVGLLMADARRALAAARAELAEGDRATARLMIASARGRLFLIDERFAALPAMRSRLRAADTGLLQLQDAVHAGDPKAPAALDRWLAESRPLEAQLAAHERQSLFDLKRLTAAANRRLPARPS
jgi:hypothetical protein